jgi:hypothetical protein
MNKYLIALALSVMVTPAYAQSAKNCVAPSLCTIISDSYPLTGPQPITCTLYNNGTLLTTTPIPVGTDGSNQKYCTFRMSFTGRNVVLTAKAQAADGEESALSSPFAFTNTAGAPAAPVLKWGP